MFLAITTVITTGLRLITTGKIQHLTMSKQLLIAFSLLGLEKVYQGRETFDAIQAWDRTLKSKLSAKTFHNHFPEGPFKERQSLAKNLPSECNRCCTHVMLQELTRGPTFGSAKHPRKRFRQSRARAVAMSVVLQLEEHVLKKRWWLLKPRSSGQFYTKGDPKNGSARRPQYVRDRSRRSE